jgi:DNA uptake protein ComE-like DNA-binding protein
MALSRWQHLSPRRRAIQAKIINDPYYRFQSAEEIAIAVELGIQIDANQASVDDWLRLPGISIHQARNLVELVGNGVQFLSLEDLAAALSVPVARLKPLAAILHFCYYETDSFLSPQRVNPNVAAGDELAQIPLLDLALARVIVQEREDKGNYRNLADLQRRLALDSKLVAQLMHYLQF